MSKNFGAFLALTIAFGAHGASAASISEARLQHLMSSTAQESVALETLRARDRDILRELAGSLADRYTDLLAGSELVFSRVSENGTLYYRLDFINLRNRDRARALCEILEMERCIATLGSDRMVILEVGGDEHVTAIAKVERDDDVFAMAAREAKPDANPQAREVEAHVRNMLDPLATFPVKRPEFDRPNEAPQEVAEPARPEREGEVESKADAPDGRADRAAPAEEGVDDPDNASESEDASVEDVNEAQLAPVPRASVIAGILATSEPREKAASRGLSPLMDGIGNSDMVEVAVAFGTSEPRVARSNPVESVRIPGLGVLTIADSDVGAPRISLARSEFPEPQTVAPEASVADLKVSDDVQAPDPVTVEPRRRASALEDLSLRQAVAAAQDAPWPQRRAMAMAQLVPDVSTKAPTMMAEMPGSDILDVDMPVPDAAPVLAQAPALNDDAEMVVASLPADLVDTTPAVRPVRVAEVAEKASGAGTRLVQDFSGADALPRIERSGGRGRAAGAQDVIRDLSQSTRLARVVFDDRYARPSTIDFSDGTDAGRLQKLPMKRGRVMSRAEPVRTLSAPLRVDSERAFLVAAGRGPVEVAQVPEAPSEARQTPEQSAPARGNDNARSRLDMLLSGEAEPRPSAGPQQGEEDASREMMDVEPPSGGNESPERPSLRPGAELPAPEPEEAPESPDEPFSLRQQAESAPQAPASADEPQEPADENIAAPAEGPEDEAQMRRSEALDALTDIVRQRRTTEPRAPEASPERMEDAADRQAREARSWQSEQNRARDAQPQMRNAPMQRAADGYASTQRRPAPRGPLNGNVDLRAAQERAGGEYVAGDNDRSDMQRRADPRRNDLMARAAPAQGAGGLTPSDLRIELYYVGAREDVMPRVEELKAFFPPVMLAKGRFFGASIPDQPNRFMVGIAARNAAAREDLIWYLEQMGMPWAMR